MLSHLTIENIVLIEKLALDFKQGLTVLTGETGAGKSILLDALGLIFGRRAEQGLVRHGTEKGTITVTLDIENQKPVHDILAEQEIDHDGRELILRRILFRDGKSKAFINDMPTTIGLLKQIGDIFLEIHGQFDTHGLLDVKTHIGLLDAFAGHGDDVAKVQTAYRHLAECRKHFDDLNQRAARQEQELQFLRFSIQEFDDLNPQDGEEETLSAARNFLVNHEKIALALQQAETCLNEEQAAQDRVQKAIGILSSVADKAAEKFNPILDALNNAAAELESALYDIRAVQDDIGLQDASDLKEMEDRLFALRDLARKHRMEISDLTAHHQKLKQDLQLIESLEDNLQKAKDNIKKAEENYKIIAEILSQKRTASAQKLQQAVMHELPAMKMERAVFSVQIEKQPIEKASERGLDQVSFLVATNAGTPAAPLNKIASGGELARFMLAIKVALRAVEKTPLLIFDEVDTGVGGSVAAAIGDRLRLLSEQAQILLVTHSPQVASKGHHHWLVSKSDKDGMTQSAVSILSAEKRREELARMLAGSEVTDEARAAADRLLDFEQKKIA